MKVILSIVLTILLTGEPPIPNNHKIEGFSTSNTGFQSIYEPAPDFTLKDLEGNPITLSELKGKVVVLDFWATWCAPCIKSFPVMQQAVDQYKDDAKVKFLFINTWEQREDPIPSVKQFVKKRGYTFQVLMDLKDPSSKKNSVVEKYQVSGIPAKFIIDGKGYIRYKAKGFTGDQEAVMEELTAMIEKAKE